MVKEVKVGEKTVKFLSNGVTPIAYKQLFNSDLLGLISEGKGTEVASDKAPELAFIMAMQAEGKNAAELMKLSQENYYDWLMQFEPLDLTMAGADIVNVYISTSLPSSEPKKKVSGNRKG